jgi:hypothetical protein
MKNVFAALITTMMTAVVSFSGYAQTSIAKETKIIEQQLNLLSAAGSKQNGKNAFEFDGCNCKYTSTPNANQSGFKMTRTNSFDLKEVSSVNYTKNEANTYELRLKLKTEDNSVTQAFDLSSINVDLYTSDEKQVKEITSRLKNVVKTCSGK